MKIRCKENPRSLSSFPRLFGGPISWSRAAEFSLNLTRIILWNADEYLCAKLYFSRF